MVHTNERRNSDQQLALKTEVQVLPFRTNLYVVDQLAEGNERSATAS